MTTREHAPPTPPTPDGMHRCAIGEPHCRQIVSTTMLMCRRHWRMVPHALQVALWKAFRRTTSGAPAMTVAYRTAREACVAAVIETIEKTRADSSTAAIQRDEQQRMPL